VFLACNVSIVAGARAAVHRNLYERSKSVSVEAGAAGSTKASKESGSFLKKRTKKLLQHWLAPSGRAAAE
jgi:hypothetical protein